MTALRLRNRLVRWTLAAATAAALPVAAGADVKAGIEAWSRGEYPAAVAEWQGPAKAGDADAQFNLAQAYKLGRGVPQDLTRAEALFGAAAAQGHPQASDNYGLLLFQRGERGKALPYLRAAADRGDPRAQYLLGIAHFNGDGLPKDWVRAYALVSLAQQSGLEQARAALAQMDQHVPLQQRQLAAKLAPELAAQAEATRARQMAAADLGTLPPAVVPPPPTAATASVAAAAATRAASPRTAGADFARPRAAAAPPEPVKPAPPVAKAPVPVKAQAAASAAPATGPWRIQLGAFGVRANAEALWNRVKSRPELAGHPRLLVPSGAVTRLLATGFASADAAQAACRKLSAAGTGCIVSRN